MKWGAWNETVENFVKSGNDWVEVAVPQGKYNSFQSAAAALHGAIQSLGYRGKIHMYSSTRYERVFLMKKEYYDENVDKRGRYEWLLDDERWGGKRYGITTSIHL